ncbi:transcriptional regulator [Candidatus Saccharibacteria bacterium]|nr:transcriptional regulator [Candidatus Saccharibacteria bacterium]
MIEQLFGSKTRVKLLQLFYGNPNRSFYVREITRKIDEQINSVRRELANLLSVGIITSDNSNNKLYYEVNQKYEYYQALLTIFGTAPDKATIGEAADETDTAPQAFKPLAGVDLVLFTGQLTRDDRSGIDVLIVGGVSNAQAQKYITELEQQESKELRYAVMTADEFQYRQKIKDRFLSLVLEAKSQVVVDRQHFITKPSSKTKKTKDKE